MSRTTKRLTPDSRALEADHKISSFLSSNGNFPFQSAPPDPDFGAGHSRPETLAAQRQLGWILNGRFKHARRIATGVPRRLSGSGTLLRVPDVHFKGGYSELKFAGDRIDRTDLKMDAWLIKRGMEVRYDIVPHPFSGRVTRDSELVWLELNSIPYKKWGLEFWTLRKGEGLQVPMTWEPGKSE